MFREKKTKIYFYFRGTLKSHIHFFQSWKKICLESGVDIQLITVLKPKIYREQIDLVKKYRSESFKIYCFPIPRLFELIFFGFNAIYYDKVVVHLKKRNPNSFIILKKLFSNIKYLIEFEGDAKSEAEYLKEHIYKIGFYDEDIKGLEINSRKEKEELEKADGVLFVSNAHRDLIMNRYGDIEVFNKSAIQPMSFKKGELYFDSTLRSRYRANLNQEDKFVIIYTGNVYYSWQNIGKTIDLFKKIKKYKENAYLQLLIREQDHEIAREFLENKEVGYEFYSLKSVPHNEIIGYLNAADLGVLLRKVHTMNSIVTSGKMVEYLACGLPTLTTMATSISDKLKEIDLVYSLKDYNTYHIEFEEVRTYINALSSVELNERKMLSEWANEEFSMEGYLNGYKDLVEAV